MDSLNAFANTLSLLGLGSESSVDALEKTLPGFKFLNTFFRSWFRVTLTGLFTFVALAGALSSGVNSLRDGASKIYWQTVRYITATISIAGNDRLNREVLNWLGAHILSKRSTRVLTANSEPLQSDAWSYRRVNTERNDYHHEKRIPVQYLPTFGSTWFIYARRIFMIKRIMTGSTRWHSASWGSAPEEFRGAPEGDEPLLVMCLGRSVEPIKLFLEECRNFADKQREAYITVRTSKPQYDPSWDTTILRPLRSLETVHFDEKIKQELVSDIQNYLDSNTRKFYNKRGIPYRRGFLLHGPPGTGKTSLSLALAGMFGLELYLLHVPSVREDGTLEKLFTTLPRRCIVLLEDVDAIGLRRTPAKYEDEKDEDEDDDDSDSDSESRHSNITLAGFLNVLDGVASQEGRIVLMTSNHADKLDSALVRPGRVDRMVYLGNISQRSSELMFLRMYSKDPDAPLPAGMVGMTEEELKRLALEFSQQIPQDIFTPAQLQGYLLNHRESPVEALAQVSSWVKEEMAIMEAANERARKAAEGKKRRKQKKKKKKQLEKAAKDLEGFDSDEALEELKKKMEEETEKNSKKLREKREGDKKRGQDETTVENTVEKEATEPSTEKKSKDEVVSNRIAVSNASVEGPDKEQEDKEVQTGGQTPAADSGSEEKSSENTNGIQN
ncbi:P-loop containing nucleoside triphosphate hydrolase protein [Podospora fimiseda]|uniref:P-loop containing nucleoside triphosphate hydrolase protein n=1 Tax=Podospora fimiseda TaxID=252190 RepID=A0AAN7BJL1_9PEZI|nr:P-loop containing nucleoside triphosphate hydrolase protein [Podospora fimiseda]